MAGRNRPAWEPLVFRAGRGPCQHGRVPERPPAIPSDRAHIWVSSEVVPGKGSDLAAFVINPTDRGLRYGILGASDRWSGGAWEPFGTWTRSLDGWGGFGSFGQPAGPVHMIGLVAEARAIGPGEYFSVPSLQPGWYRIGHGEAHGTFEVTETAPMTHRSEGSRRRAPW
jgi:hypothetical protein